MLRCVHCNPSYPTTTCACTLKTTFSTPFVLPCIVCLRRPPPDFLICISHIHAPVPSSICAALSLKPTSVWRKHAQRRPTMFLFCCLCVCAAALHIVSCCRSPVKTFALLPSGSSAPFSRPRFPVLVPKMRLNSLPNLTLTDFAQQLQLRPVTRMVDPPVDADVLARS